MTHHISYERSYFRLYVFTYLDEFSDHELFWSNYKFTTFLFRETNMTEFQ